MHSNPKFMQDETPLISDMQEYGWSRLASAVVLCAGLWSATEAAAQVGPVLPTSPPAKAKQLSESAEPATSEPVKDKAATEVEKTAAKGEAKPNAAPVQDVYEIFRSLSLAKLIVWLRDRGPSIVIVLVVMTGILWLANLLQRRLVRILASAANRGSSFEQENRARTVVGVMHNMLRTVVYALACIMILETAGVSVGPLLGGVAVFGIAVAFGVQSLVKDYFTGFLVLLEQQYIIGDVVRFSGNNFNGLTGQVEQISLRVTTIRDIEGAAHFISHGQITVVSNLTPGWSQAVFDIQIANSEPLERVQKEFCELAGALREDAKFGAMILNDAEMLGVDSLGDTTFTVKFVLRTMPLKRWEVKRELLRRIKQRFDELKIKIIIPA
jgi:small-conductance mechanosensitive channel